MPAPDAFIQISCDQLDKYTQADVTWICEAHKGKQTWLQQTYAQAASRKGLLAAARGTCQSGQHCVHGDASVAQPLGRRKKGFTCQIARSSLAR